MMKHTLIKLLSGSLVSLAAVFFIAGCDRDEPVASSTSSSSTPAAAVPPDLILAEAPAGAKDVIEVKRDATEGEEVVVRGRVGGDVEPFAKGFATVQLVDLTLDSCADNPADACETPWDYCCDESAKKNSLMVQINDDSGKPLKSTLEGVGGMKGLSEVTVKGKVQRLPGSDAVVINATGIHVKG